MTAQEYRAAIEALGFNQVDAAAFFELGVRTSRQYAATGAPVPVEMVLRLMLRYKISPASVDRLLGRVPA